jgi:non-specific serine/threonine protein kinase
MSGGASFGEMLRRHRHARRLTQAELAEQASLSERAISDLERGLKRPQRATVQLLIEAFGMAPDVGEEFERAARTPAAVSEVARNVAPKHNLPAAATTFVGRSGDIEGLLHVLESDPSDVRSARLVTLVGAGGMGKTRLAVEVARLVVDRYADGIRFVELAAVRDPSLVPQTVAAALPVHEQSDRTLLDTLVASLRDMELLLILDNCEHLIQASAEQAALVLRACPAVRILATSREPLRIEGERIWRVGPLSLPPPPVDHVQNAIALRFEAVQLFVERAQSVVPEFALTTRNAPAVRDACFRLDGIPLALELAAARVRQLDVEQIAALLQDRFRLLVAGNRAAPQRHQTLRATVDWSYELLSEAERHLFERLAIFSGGWTLHAAEAVCGGDVLAQTNLLDLHGQLVDKSLVYTERADSQTPLRYGMLETLRQYAQERLVSGSNADSVALRHVQYYLEMAEQAELELRGADQVGWLERLEVDHENLRAAWRWSMQHRPDLAMRLAAALWRFWELHGHLTEGRDCLGETLSLVDSSNSHSDLQARLHNGAGNLASDQGDFVHARAHHEEALAIRRRVGDWRGVAGSLNNLGDVASGQGDHESARSLFEEALAIHRERGDRWGIGLLLLNLGVNARDRSDYALARTLLQDSMTIMRGLGDRWGVALVLNVLGSLAHRNGDLSLASSHYQESLTILRDLGERRRIAFSLDSVASLAASLGQVQKAMRLAAAADALRESIGAAPDQQAELQSPLESAEAALSEEARESLWREGRAMTVDQAVELALEPYGATTTTRLAARTSRTRD